MRKLALLCGLALLLSVPAIAQDHPRAEVFGGYSYLRINPGGGEPGINVPRGWAASAAVNVNNWFGIVAEFSGHYKSVEDPTGNDKLHTFLFGPRITIRKHEKIQPFAHVLFGGAHFLAEATVDGTPVSFSTNTFAMTAGGGIDAVVHHNVAIRVIQVDYLMTRIGGNSQNNIRLATGIVFRFGGR